jgi:transposase, IS605 orfB family
MTDKMNQISFNRKNKSSDYIYKAVNYIINYCKDNDIGTIVAGYSDTFQCKTNLGTANNQTFVTMPFAQISKFLSIYTYLNGMSYFTQDEAYTSKASFFDKDPLPNYGDTNIPEFSGKRVKRGLYRTKNGYEFNADVNGALNILRKSNVVSLEALYARGEVDTPIRIRIK